MLCLMTCWSAASLYAQWNVATLVPGSSGMEDGLVLDKEGNIYVSQFDSTVVRKVTPEGEVSIYASGFNAPNGLAMDDGGTLYVTNAQGGRVSKVTPDGTVVQSFISGLANPTGVAVSPNNDTLYIAHYGSSRISKVALADSNNVIDWVSGNPLNGPVGMTFDEDGMLYVGGFNDGGIVKIDADGTMMRIATIPPFMGFLTYAKGLLYATSFGTNRIYSVSVDGSSVELFAGTGAAGQQNGPVESATFDGPNGIAASASGDTLYVSEYNSETLRQIILAAATDVEDEMSDVPVAEFFLEQNYPNPFNQTTTISYQQATPARATLRIYNMLGQKVRTFARLPSTTGRIAVDWDGHNDAGQRLPNGMYFYTLSTENQTASKSLLLLR